ncbi:MAG: hypothetical protein JWR61_2504 [Ferruginibacter sp.]|uniref:beta strand repeat-containing protein n=1 Tax=Ferruginibacter sp. TaxID=1940288 RepID=UPI00265AF7B7|nr:hypothetical protein [Ferruginibacter sp.]MDB5277549.1 hypothetical protein [Ferruginibacter sp.]
MKKLYLVTLLILQLALATKTKAQNVGINATSSLPDNSAMLDVSATDKGFLAPRLTTAQQNAISLPATGLLIFNTTDNVFKVNTGTPAVPLWTPLAMGSGAAISSLNGLTGVTQTFATGTSGTDFGITSSGTAHTFNLPTASAVNRGALSSSDWSIFNSKLGLTSLSATTPLSYNNTTGAFSINQANTTTNGYLSNADWNTFNGKQGAISLTTTGGSGAATLVGNTLNIPNYAGLSSLSATAPLTYNSGTGAFAITQATTSANGYLSNTDWNIFNSKQTAINGTGFVKASGTTISYDNNTYLTSATGRTNISLTTTGTSGAATYNNITGVLNVPVYPSNAGTVTSVAALTLGTTGTDLTSTVATGTTTPVITLNVPTASATNRGALSSADWTAFNGKQAAISLTTTGNNGAATFAANTLNVPTYTLAGLGGISLSALSSSAPLTYNNTTGAFAITQATTSTNGYLSSADWNTFNNKQGTVSGTANRISVAAGVVDISSTYIGQNTITTLGTIGTGTWQGTAVGAIYGGTGQTSVTTGDLLYGSAANTWSKLPAGANGQVLTLAGGIPSWSSNPGSTAWSLTGNSVTAGSQFLGSTNNVSLRMRTNNVERMVVDSTGKVGVGTSSPLATIHVKTGASGASSISSLANQFLVEGPSNTGMTILSPDANDSRILFASPGNSIGAQLVWRYSSNLLRIGTYNTGGQIAFENGIGSEQMRIDAVGNVGFGITAPTANIHLKASTGAAKTAPLKFNAGTNLTTPEDGAVEYNGTHFYGTIGSTRYQLDQQATGTAWSLTGNAATAGSHFLGSTNNVSLRFRTNNTERMIIDSTGKVGVGLTDPTAGYYLSVKDNLEIRRTATTAQMIFTNTAGSGNFRIGGDGGDIYWQGGGGQSLQMGSYWATILGGDRQTAAFPAFIGGISGTSVIVASQRDASVALGIQGNSATQTANLTEWKTSSGNVLDVVDEAGNVGIGVTTPSAALHLGAGTAAANTAPLKFTAGTNLTTPENGAVEFNGTHFYGTVGGTRYQLDQQAGGGTTTVANGGTGQTSNLTAGGVIYGASTTAMGSTAAGTTGQILQSAGAATPVWVNGGTMMLSGNTNNSTETTSSGGQKNYYPITGTISSVSTSDVQAGTRTVMSRAGTIRNLFVKLDGSPGGGNNLIVTVYKNGTAQTLTTTIGNPSVSGSDTSNSFTVAAGDEVGIVISSTSAPGTHRRVSWSADFTY